MPENVVQLANQNGQAAVEDAVAETWSVYNPEHFSYLTPALEKLIEALVRCVNDKGILTVVTGQQGSGKTTLLRQFLKQTRPEWELCLIQANHVIGEKHILEQLNNRFFPNQKYTIEILADRLATNTDKAWPVILVDDAHNLSSFALDVLLSLKYSIEEQGGRLGLVLLALPAIQEVLSSPSLLRHDEVVRLIDMPALTAQQVLEYIEQLLEASGLGSQLCLSHAQKQMIVRRSLGQPGLINMLLAQAAKKGGREPAHVSLWMQHHLKQPRLWAGAAMILLLVYGLSSLMKPGADKETATAEIAVAVVAEQATQSQSQNNPAAIAAKIPQNKAPNKSPLTKSSAAIDKPLVNTVVSRQVTPDKSGSKTKASELAAKPSLNTTAGSDSAIAMSEKPLVSPVNEPVNGQEWLAAQNKGDYTIQLAASAYEDAIERFIRRQPAMDGLRYVHIVRRGKDWYVTLFGSYTSFAMAKEAIADLPPGLRKNDPWIRRISTLQDMMPKAAQAEPEIVMPDVKQTEADAVDKTSLPTVSELPVSVANEVMTPAIDNAGKADTGSSAEAKEGADTAVEDATVSTDNAGNTSAGISDEVQESADTAVAPAVVSSDSAAMPAPVTSQPE